MAGLIAIIFGLSMMIGAFIIEGGNPMTLIVHPSPFMIVLGGTFAAVLCAFPMEQVKTLGSVIKVCFGKSNRDMVKLASYCKDLATKARTNGLLVLEQELQENKTLDPFFAKALQLAIDGTDSDTLHKIMETNMAAIEERHKVGIAIFESAGGFCPTMGIIGTVLGLISVLGSLEGAEGLGEKIAVAFIATLYGVGLANIAFLPMGNRLKMLHKEEMLEKEMMMEAVMGLQEGIAPNSMMQRLKSFLNAEELNKLEKLEGTEI